MIKRKKLLFVFNFILLFSCKVDTKYENDFFSISHSTDFEIECKIDEHYWVVVHNDTVVGSLILNGKVNFMTEAYPKVVQRSTFDLDPIGIEQSLPEYRIVDDIEGQDIDKFRTHNVVFSIKKNSLYKYVWPIYDSTLYYGMFVDSVGTCGDKEVLRFNAEIYLNDEISHDDILNFLHGITLKTNLYSNECTYSMP